MLLEEAGYPPRAYIPHADVTAKLSKTAKTTHCPFKGDTVYDTVTSGDVSAENAAWSYPAPFDEMIGITGLIAFDDTFTVSIDGGHRRLG